MPTSHTHWPHPSTLTHWPHSSPLSHWPHPSTLTHGPSLTGRTHRLSLTTPRGPQQAGIYALPYNGVNITHVHVDILLIIYQLQTSNLIHYISSHSQTTPMNPHSLAIPIDPHTSTLTDHTLDPHWPHSGALSGSVTTPHSLATPIDPVYLTSPILWPHPITLMPSP